MRLRTNQKIHRRPLNTFPAAPIKKLCRLSMVRGLGQEIWKVIKNMAELTKLTFIFDAREQFLTNDAKHLNLILFDCPAQIFGRSGTSLPTPPEK